MGLSKQFNTNIRYTIRVSGHISWNVPNEILSDRYPMIQEIKAGHPKLNFSQILRIK